MNPKIILYAVSFYFLFLGLSAVIVGIYGLTRGLSDGIITFLGLNKDSINTYLIFSLIIGCITIISGAGLFLMKNWARYAAIIVGAIISGGWISFGLMIIMLYFLWWYKPIINLFQKTKKVNEWGEEIPNS